MYPKFKLVSIILRNLFSIFKTSEFVSKMSASSRGQIDKQNMTQNDLHGCRIINKMGANTKGCYCRKLPNHSEFSCTSLYLRYSKLHRLSSQSNDKNRERRQRKLNDVTDVISLSLILYSFPVFGTFLKGEKADFRQSFLGDICTVAICNNHRTL